MKTTTKPKRVTPLPIKIGHKHEGGTGITNFSLWELPYYRASLKKHGDRFLKVVEFDFMDRTHTGYASLHDTDPRRHPYGDLSAFWAIHRAMHPGFTFEDKWRGKQHLHPSNQFKSVKLPTP